MHLHLSDKLDYSGDGRAFARLLKSMDDYALGERGDYGFSLYDRSIYASSTDGLAHMRRLVALFVKLDGDLRGGFDTLASDEHLCVECVPGPWSMWEGTIAAPVANPVSLTGDRWDADLLHEHGFAVPWELIYDRSCQIIGRTCSLTSDHAHVARIAAMIDLRRATVPAHIYEQIERQARGVRHVDDLNRLQRALRGRPTLADYRATVARLVDATWVTCNAVEQSRATD